MKGTKGFIMSDYEGNLFFRVYQNKDFIDYDLQNAELEVTIEDDDCFLYNNKFLSYSKETLGME